jgi:serine/threonine protein kinase/Tfp pilus assembly protein PilF
MATDPIQIGPYHGWRVATGGFADVYHVPQSHHGIPVAIKWAHTLTDTSADDSLAHEFSVLNELAHRRIPRALAYGHAGDRPYLALEWIDGHPLNQSDASVSEETFTQMLREIAAVLTFIHQRGWVHGDLKPDNLIWRSPSPVHKFTSDTLCLLDFGLARPAGDSLRPRGAGTVGYTAPEFLRREPADGRADWYSVGIILYEWLFGQRPFAADDTAIEIAGHLEQSPNLERTAVKSAPAWAKEVLARLLAKQPVARGSDVFDLLTWLSQFDPDLHPDRIINAQVDDHRCSEDRRLTSAETDIVNQINTATSEPCTWVIYADPATETRLTIGLQSAAARADSSLLITGSSGEQAANSPAESRGDHATIVTLRALSQSHHTRIEDNDSRGRIALSMLPGDVEYVKGYLSRLLGDEDFAQQWSGPVWEATGGLPSALSNLFAYLFQNALLIRRGGLWEMADSALLDWQHRPEAATVFAVAIGELTTDERRQLDWFATCRSFMHVDVLRELMPVLSERFLRAFASLRERGIIIPVTDERVTTFFEWRLRFAGLADIWRVHMPATLRRGHALRLASLIESCSVEADVTVSEVLAEAFADAEVWDKCVHYSVSVVASCVKENRQDEAHPYVLLAEAAADRIQEGRTRSHWLGRARMARGDYQKACGLIEDAQRTYRELLVLCRRSNDRRLLAETLRDLGDLYRMTRHFEKGVRVLRRARQLWEAIGDRSEVARTLNNLGNMYWVAADRAEARRYYAQALEIAEELGEDRTVAMILSNLGVAYKCEYDLARAESYYRASLAIKERLNLPGEIALTVNNLGVIAYDQGRLDEADRYFRRAIALNEDIGAEVEAVFARGNLTQVILERGDLRQMIAEGDRAVRDAETLGDTTTAAEIRVLMAEGYLRAGDFRIAAHCVERARRATADQRNDDLSAHLGLVEALRNLRLGRHDEAIAALDDIDEAIAAAEMPRLRLDALMIRLHIAVAHNDDNLADDLWQQAEGMARAFSAPHKLAQAALARLPGDGSRGYPREVKDEINNFLSRSDERWHWLGAYYLWTAEALAASGDQDAAQQAASVACDRLREDGNWEMLWRALVVSGQIHFERSDYEPALRAFDEAHHIRSEIARTIDDPSEQSSYEANPYAARLTEMRTRILELVS